ncbi:hypothetical protein [Glycomyces algeriensis]|uniref:Uncharacterized protein n=1 Tax=Glycomyces algeriensis TaxID=256037 RepID=A0A9W6LG89_9ACTN|nr:hypothetical protein [Glycomyces algeriensis]MDA1368479.1 hypothetical protein [Glycomyces algeriensis]MDR7348742.1 hypothetical protein [Glycomyces algeriensis]GLI41444.1 hypothetical protein GALLR39Z86_12940 [Glycomyces algeriensis]
MSGTSFSGQRMESRIGSFLGPERTSILVRRMRISGACLGIALIAVSVVLGTMNGGFEWTDYHSSTARSNGGTGLSWEGSGVVFGLVFLIGPLGFGYALRAGAGDLLYLNGTELTVVKPGRRAPTVFDLARVRSEVRLEKVPGTRPGSAEAREKVGSHRPVLVLLSETGRREAVIELADQRSRAMRLSNETRALEAALRCGADPATQHAAGQLRTLLRWTRLPVIHDAAPDAIPASPEDATSAPIPRTRVASGVEGPEIEVAGPGRS